ncbi:MAG: hypothetical protein AAGK09_00870 [Planctomycetota bacterium]
MNPRHALLTLTFVAAATLGSGAFAQSGDSGPSLDELLGLPSDTDRPTPSDPGSGSDPATTDGDPDATTPMADDPATAVELDPEVARQLRGETMRDNPFESSLIDMTEAADRLGREQDPGLTTQRLMQEAIDKLDRVIAAAQQQQSGGGESSESSDQRDADAGSQQLARQGASGQRQGAASGRQTNTASGENSGEASPGAVAEGSVANDPIAEARREWGNLPPRVRRELSEGVNERISPLYRGLTEQYFEALSEER